MSEYISESPAQRTLEELRPIVGVLFGMSDLTIPPAIISYTDDSTYAGRFPASSESDDKGTLTMLYHKQTLTELVSSYDEPQLFGALERVYLAGGLIVGAVFNQVDHMDSEGLNQLYGAIERVDVLTNTINDHGISNDMVIDTDTDEQQELIRQKIQEDRITQITALLNADNKSRVALGLQRLTTGICGIAYGETEAMNALQRSAQIDMRRGLRDYNQSKALFYAGNMSEDDATIKANKRFKDAVTEMTWALCYPMSPEEIRRVLVVCEAAGSFDEQQVLDPRDLNDGFSIE